uniref:Transthyretin-like family-containing protein n=1 Tax=Strongyloides stercoralis TaxID=6248 RepID=A0A0K0DZF1_STRER
MLLYKIIIIYLFFIFKITNAFFRRRYAIGVTGRFYCYGEPDNNVQVQLCRKNWRGKLITIGTERSDTYGNFELVGTKSLFTKMRPILKIIHYCDERNFRCHNVAFLPISKKAIYRGRRVKGLFNFGVVEILTLKDQKRVCISRRSFSRRRRQGKAE